jgi:DNA invertase Pin-like site-specific DNA recombinase
VVALGGKVLAVAAQPVQGGTDIDADTQVPVAVARALTDALLGCPAAVMALLMLGTFAEMELIFQRERRASARDSREANGKTWGRPREIDRAAVLEDLSDGMSVMKVAAKHGIGRATVFRIKGEAKES